MKKIPVSKQTFSPELNWRPVGSLSHSPFFQAVVCSHFRSKWQNWKHVCLVIGTCRQRQLSASLKNVTRSGLSCKIVINLIPDSGAYRSQLKECQNGTYGNWGEFGQHRFHHLRTWNGLVWQDSV